MMILIIHDQLNVEPEQPAAIVAEDDITDAHTPERKRRKKKQHNRKHNETEEKREVVSTLIHPNNGQLLYLICVMLFLGGHCYFHEIKRCCEVVLFFASYGGGNFGP
jgi:hypothetical protein